ncbi:apolipoprotein N-acyltransferase [bacterium]|nr:apolipoprotein N-acyltransferase [bacterium]
MLWRVAAAVLAGFLLAASFPLSLPAVDAFPELGVWHFFIGTKDISEGFIQFQGLGCIALLPFLLALRGTRRPAHAFWLGYVFGLAWLLPGLIWLGSFGVVPVLLLPLYFALPLGLFGYLCWWLINTRWAAASPARFVWGVPLVWTAIEYLRSFGFWAFPWNLLGYSLAREPLLIQGADLGGVYLVSFGIVLCNSTLAVLLLRPPQEQLELLRPLKAWRWRARFGQAAAGTAVLCVLLVYGLWRLELLQLPKLWPLALLAHAQEAQPGPAAQPPAGGQAAAENGASAKGDSAKDSAKSKQDSSRNDKGKQKDSAGSKNKKKRPAAPAVQRELPLDVILVQGGLNTRESWRTPGLLDRTVRSYVEPAEEAIKTWLSLGPQGFGAATPPDGSKGADRSGQAQAREYQPPLGSQAPPAGTVERGVGAAESQAQQDGLSSALAFQNAMGGDAMPGMAQTDQELKVSFAPGGAALRADPPQADLLVVWPEGVLPIHLDPSKASNLPSPARRMLRKAENSALLMGAIGEPREPGFLENGSMFYTRDGTAIWPHSKVRVVPFGEVLPFRRAVSFLDYPWGEDDISEGRSIEPLRWRGHDLGLMICFDNVFGFLCRAEALKGADSFVLMTNNSWYKLPSGVRQHTDIDILRAVENRRWLARVSTTGESHIVDSAGRVRQQSRQRSAALISGRLESSSERPVYLRVGDLFAQLCLLGALLVCLPPILLRRGENML